MGSAHDLLSHGDWQGASLAELAASVLSPYFGPESSRLDLNGPDVALQADAVVSLGLILQELATNAIRYGAWSGEDGRVTLSWEKTVADGGTLKIEWREDGGPPARAPETRGFGLEFMTRSAEHELSGSCEHAFPSEGHHCVLLAPASAVLKAQDTAAGAIPRAE